MIKNDVNALLLLAVGPDTSPDALLRRIATQLHQGGPPITGQTSNVVMKDACVWLNTQQPLCKAFVVTEDDVRFVKLQL